MLPCQVYRFDEATGDVRVVADGFNRPNGLCFSPDEQTMYITGKPPYSNANVRELKLISFPKQQTRDTFTAMVRMLGEMRPDGG